MKRCRRSWRSGSGPRIALAQACLVVVTGGEAPRAEGISAYNLVIKAVQARGDNPSLLKTGKAEIAATVNRRVREVDIKRQVDAHRRQLAEVRRRESSVDTQRILDDLLSDDGVAEYREKLIERNGSARFAYYLAFNAAQEPFSRVSRLQSFDPRHQKYVPLTEDFLQWDHTAKVKSIKYDVPARLVRVGTGRRELVEFERFGRFQGVLAENLASLLVESGANERDSQKAAALDMLRDKVTSGVVPVCRTTGKESFEGGEVAVVEWGLLNGESGTRVWIDDRKGFVTPLIEEFGAGGVLRKRYASSGYVRVATSDLWYPAKHEESSFDEQTGELAVSTVFETNMKTLRLNEAIAEEEFAVRVPRGVTVADERGGGVGTQRMAADVVSLQFKAGQLDLDGLPGLSRQQEQDSSVWSNVAALLRRLSWRFWLTAINCLILFALLGVLARKAVLARRSERESRGRRDRR
jgi:hypothetical protein